MNANPNQSTPDARADLARLLPPPAERDLSSDRHRLIQEFVMTQIHTARSPAGPAPRRVPRRRLILASALTAVAAATAAVVLIGAAGPGSTGGDRAPTEVGTSGQRILLAAATTAEKMPAASGTYWYLRTESVGPPSESWTGRDGRTWVRGAKTGGAVLELPLPTSFRLGGPDVTFDELQRLPTEPAALKQWIARSVRNSDVRTSAGRPNAALREQMVFDGLLSLVAQLPAPPNVRAAAFQAIAAYPEVRSTGATEGGQGLLIRLGAEPPARLVVDPATARIRRTNFYVTPDGARVSREGDGMFTLTAEWTDRLPA
ncbi:CU044_5270 family protein [Micromonospora soli]|uniref:CU044_5270 family protein n=1 Tax=Micromonospora sp. NBRC 110009 TaxID=3061627 RepID=UPI0026732A18|nr:CU044_5270 family protein [Micromonospora sp. NBRC 110009]WKT99320.1 CU044_5270 family protein [Micromonospora sp. NBRC 110009]